MESLEAPARGGMSRESGQPEAVARGDEPAPCSPELAEVPGSAVMVAGQTHIDAADLDAEVVVHLLYTLQHTDGLALAPGRAPALRSALVRLRKDLLVLSNLEVSITTLLSDRDKETLLVAMAEEDQPLLTLDALAEHLSRLSADLLEQNRTSGCEVPPVPGDVYLPRPWRFGFPITALVAGLPERLEQGNLDPDTLCRLAALLGQAREATADARDALDALPSAVEAVGLTFDRILRLPKDEKKRFTSSRPWEPVLVGMLEAVISTL